MLYTIGLSFKRMVKHLTSLSLTELKDCSYANPDEMVRDMVVIGINNTKIREKLINVGSELTSRHSTFTLTLNLLSKIYGS